MKKLIIIVLIFTFCNVNGQELPERVKFTAIGSENYFKATDSVLDSISNTLSSIKREATVSIYQFLKLENDQAITVNKLQKVKLVGYYQIAENLSITTPYWEFDNIDAFGFKLFYKIK